MSIFFDLVESLYTFFSASTYRWRLLSAAVSDDGAQSSVVKKMSDTWWWAHADATKALLHNFSAVKQVLERISSNSDQKAVCQQQARGQLTTLVKLE